MPKAVEITHRGLSNLVSWYQEAFCPTPEDRITQLSGFSFDAAVWEIWPALSSGSSLYLVPEHLRAAPKELVDYFATNLITIAFLPTPLAELLLNQNWPNDICLRMLHTAGEKLHSCPQFPMPFAFYNLYGPTENSVATTCMPVASGHQTTAPPIGRAIGNVRTYVLDSNQQLVPVGVPGELCIAGEGLARGYAQRSRLTAEKFIPNPFSEDQGGRLYRTGDLVRYLPDMTLEFLGRIDQQVKLHGFRIELGEIEAVLAQAPGVSQTAVVVREDSSGRKRIVAYFVPSDQPKPALELMQYLRDRLPAFMLPSVFVELAGMPLSTGGKIDRRRLPEPAARNEELLPDYVAPSTAMENLLASIWTEVLCIEKVGVRNNFFELGGNSLLLMQAHTEMQQRLRMKLEVIHLFRYPTIETLANFLTSETSSCPGATPTGDEIRASLRSRLVEQRRLRQTANS